MHHHRHLPRPHAERIGAVAVENFRHLLKFAEVVARAKGGEPGIAQHAAPRILQRLGRVSRLTGDMRRAVQLRRLADHLRKIDVGEQPFALAAHGVPECAEAAGKQGGHGGGRGRHVARRFQQIALEQAHQFFLARQKALQAQVEHVQAHAAVDVAPDRFGDDEVMVGDEDAADRHRSAGVEVGRGAGAADVTARRMAHAGKSQQLGDGFRFQRQAGGQQNFGVHVGLERGLDTHNVALSTGDDVLRGEGFGQARGLVLA